MKRRILCILFVCCLLLLSGCREPVPPQVNLSATGPETTVVEPTAGTAESTTAATEPEDTKAAKVTTTPTEPQATEETKAPTYATEPIEPSKPEPTIPKPTEPAPPRSLLPPRLCHRNRPQRKLYHLPQSRSRHSLRKQSQHQQNVNMIGSVLLTQRLGIGELGSCATVGGQCMATRTS